MRSIFGFNIEQNERKLYEYVEVYYETRSILVRICVGFHKGCLYTIFWRSLYAGPNMIL